MLMISIHLTTFVGIIQLQKRGKQRIKPCSVSLMHDLSFMHITLPVDQLRLRCQPGLENPLELDVPCEISDACIVLAFCACLLAMRGAGRIDGSVECQPATPHQQLKIID